MVNKTNIRTFDLKDLAVGKLLGVGAFSVVFSVTVRHGRAMSFDALEAGTEMKEDNCGDAGVSQTTERTISYKSFSSTGSSICSLTSHRYSGASFYLEQKRALKQLHERVLDCPHKTEQAFQDMHNEVLLLSKLPFHPNIIQITGISSDFWDSPATAFFVQEQLAESLESAIARWQKENSSCRVKLRPRKTYCSPELQLQRIAKAAVGVASALAFLHENKIIFRDVKPANIGFDYWGKVRLFDFGLARYVEEENGVSETEMLKSNLKGMVGTLRYMAPEVAQSGEYTFSADVYSFGLLLWQLCTLERPYDYIKTTGTLKSMVKRKEKIPPLSLIALPRVKALLKDCLSDIPTCRPSFEQIVMKLNYEIKGAV